MNPTSFPEQTCEVAKDQDEYETLPAHQNPTESISLWRLTVTERLRILLFGRLWVRQCNFGHPLQPISLQVEYPFIKETTND